MSNIYEYTFDAQKNKNQSACRVAYTLNNTQPVVCTIIGEQPLFYMDHEEALDDGNNVLDTSLVDTEFDLSAFASSEEDFFTEEDLDILKDEIKNLKDQIKSYDKFSADFVDTDQARIEKFLDNAELVTKLEDTSKVQSIDTVLDILTQSRLAQSYLEFAKENNVEIAFSTQIETAEYNRKNKVIFVNANQDLSDVILSLATELRRHWQHSHGALINPLMFHPDQAILINRAQIADLSVSVIRIAWELQLAGHKQTWERLENSSMADMARSFAREAFLDFRTINNGEAAAAVFESWFLSERCRSQDKALIQQMLSDYKGFVFDLDEASKSVTPDLIAALGEMPYGKNYLSAHVVTIMNDPIFTDIRDRANANFLWFIKFERTFKEAEAEMEKNGQSCDGLTPSEVLQNAAKDGDLAEVISFPGCDADKKSEAQPSKRLQKNSDSKKSDRSAEIVYLRRWPAE